VEADRTLSRWFMQGMNELPVTYFVKVTNNASIILKGSYHPHVIDQVT
jgi:hypothetical protein